MDAVEDPVALVACLRKEHRAEWDRRWNDLEVAGVDLVSLDTRLGGCTYTWVARGGSLHERGMATVRLILSQRWPNVIHHPEAAAQRAGVTGFMGARADSGRVSVVIFPAGIGSEALPDDHQRIMAIMRDAAGPVRD